MYQRESSETVAICLATFNGEEYLRQQLDSVLSQSYRDWKLYVRDDGSEDDTKEIVEEYCYGDSRIVLVHNAKPVHSATQNFIALHEWVRKNAEYDYLMFCDQDDVWFPNKIEITLRAMKLAEESCNCPILVHTDAAIVNKELKIIAESRFGYRSLNPKKSDFSHLLVLNNVQGCSLMINKSLDNAVVYGPGVLYHDWWVALVAAAFGKIVYVNSQSLLYRQHEDNTLGAIKVNSVSYVFERIAATKSMREKIRRTLDLPFGQAEGFLRVYSDSLSMANNELIKQYLSITEKPKIARQYILIRNGLMRQGFVQIIGQILLA